MSWLISNPTTNGWVEDTATGVAVWILGLICGMAWAHRKIVKPSRDRHEELVQLHAEHAAKLDKVHKSITG